MIFTIRNKYELLEKLVYGSSGCANKVNAHGQKASLVSLRGNHMDTDKCVYKHMNVDPREDSRKSVMSGCGWDHIMTGHQHIQWIFNFRFVEYYVYCLVQWSRKFKSGLLRVA